jgi:hypothetical protein
MKAIRPNANSKRALGERPSVVESVSGTLEAQCYFRRLKSRGHKADTRSSTGFTCQETGPL